MIGISVLGAGVIGSIHARNVARHPQCALIHVADLDGAKASRLAAECCAADRRTSVEAVLGDERVDAVIIASSTAAHAEHVQAAAGAGKAMLVEKPIASNLDQAASCLAIVEATGVVAAMGFNRRLDATHHALYDSVRAGNVGAIEMLHLTARSQSAPDPSTVPMAGGMLREKGSHFFDLACWIADQPPAEVFVAGACLVDPRFADYGDVDTAVVTLRLGNGALASFDFSRRTAFGYEELIEVFGSEGMLESRRQRHRALSLYKGNMVIEDGLHPGWWERFEDTYYDELGAFIGAVRHLSPLHATLRDGYRAQAVAEAAIRSATDNRPVAVVTLPEDDLS